MFPFVGINSSVLLQKVTASSKNVLYFMGSSNLIIELYPEPRESSIKPDPPPGFFKIRIF
jgi:hypothetical protein